MTSRHKGFTLIELLVVIAIIGLLSSVVLASLSGARESAKVTRTVSDFRQFETAMTLWMQSSGQTVWPTESDLGLGQSPAMKDIATTTTLGEYLTTVPDPQFGDFYQYDYDGDVFTCGDPYFKGVLVVVNSSSAIDQGVIDRVNQILDGDIKTGGDPDLDCGKIRSKEDGTNIIYQISSDGIF